MAKRIAKVTIVSNPSTSSSVNEKYYIEDILQLKEEGADNLFQVDARYKDGEVAKSIVGVRQGVTLVGQEDRIALPCPPYCHPNTEGEPRGVGELTFLEALEKLNE